MQPETHEKSNSNHSQCLCSLSFALDPLSQVKHALITALSLTKLERFPIRDRTAASKLATPSTSSTILDAAERPTAKSHRVVLSRTSRVARYCALRRYCQFHIWGGFLLSTQFTALHGTTAKTINYNLKTAALTKLHIRKVTTIKETCMHSN